MSFLTPLFLIGLGAIAGPILFHLFRRNTDKVYTFSSIKFLSQSPPRPEKRRRIENLPLLLLRLLVLTLLALAFARPYLVGETLPEEDEIPDQYTVIALDTSASMRREDLWSQAIDKVRDRVSNRRPGESIEVLAFNSQAESLGILRDDAEESASQSMEALLPKEPSYFATDLAEALIQAAERIQAEQSKTLARDREFVGMVVAISDFQRGANLEGLQAYSWPADIEIDLEPLEVARPTNASLRALSSAAVDSPTQGLPIRVSASEDSLKTRFQVQTPTPERSPISVVDVFVGPGQSTVIDTPKPPSSGVFTLRGDESDFDNQFFVAPPSKPVVQVEFLTTADSSPRKSILPFLEAALSSLASFEFQLTPFEPSESSSSDADILIATRAPSLAAQTAIRNRIEAGRPVIYLVEDVESGLALGRILRAPSLPVSESADEDYFLIGSVDFQDPIFQPFNDPKYSNFSKISFWKYRRMDFSALPEVKVLAQFDNRDPAMIRFKSLYALCATWTLEDGQLGLSTKFAPLIASILRDSGALAAAATGYIVGDTIQPAEFPATIKSPDGKLSDALGADASALAHVPGIYEIVTPSNRYEIAVNLAASESATGMMPLENLMTLIESSRPAPTEPEQTSTSEPLATDDPARWERDHKIWKWLILVAILLLVTESFVIVSTDRNSTA